MKENANPDQQDYELSKKSKQSLFSKANNFLDSKTGLGVWSFAFVACAALLFSVLLLPILPGILGPLAVAGIAGTFALTASNYTHNMAKRNQIITQPNYTPTQQMMRDFEKVPHILKDFRSLHFGTPGLLKNKENQLIESTDLSQYAKKVIKDQGLIECFDKLTISDKVQVITSLDKIIKDEFINRQLPTEDKKKEMLDRILNSEDIGITTKNILCQKGLSNGFKLLTDEGKCDVMFKILLIQGENNYYMNQRLYEDTLPKSSILEVKTSPKRQINNSPLNPALTAPVKKGLISEIKLGR